ncbi:MAG: hypothetical protein JNN15_13665 [Blastocatellia bacterium]|nr:hypothetical protein [Blastocatellia bacterium]
MNNPNEKKKVESPISEIKTVEEITKQPSFSSEDLSGGNLDKVRDILFGSQMRSFEKRLTRLEEKVVRETSDLRNDIKTRFDNIEVFIKKEIESLSDRLKAEERERLAAQKEITVELRDSAKAFEKRLIQLDDQTTKNHRDLSQQLIEKSRSLSEEIRQKYDDLVATLERETQELRLEKTDRSSLATMFTELAMRLNNEFKIPGSE